MSDSTGMRGGAGGGGAANSHARSGPAQHQTQPAQHQVQPAQSEAQPARPLTHATLRSAFCDLLGRPPFEAERTAWLGKARHELCDHWIGGEPFWAHWLDEQLYYFFLIDNFRPESERVLAIPRDLAAGALDPRDATQRIALSPSFDQRNPGADTFVTVVMEQFAGITVQKNVRELEIGKAIYDGASGTFLGRSGKRQADIVDIAVHHKAFADTFIAREYRRLLGVDAPPKERADWSRRFHAAPVDYVKIFREWMLSETWEQRARTRLPLANRQFARTLYVDLLDRLPDEDEARRLRSALDGMSDAAPLRSIFARILIDSGAVKLPDKTAIADARAWVAGLFQKLLARDATGAELDAFVSAFADPACRPQTVLYALVTHPQYQSY
jgi:hypothetical protein